MGGSADRRIGGRLTRCASAVAIAGLLTAYPPNRLSAQVGHDPSHSPYRDVRRGGVAVITFGYLGGERGGPGVGMANGPSGGLRYEVSFGSALGASLGIAYAKPTRFVIDPTKDSLSRKTGPFDSDVILADVGLQLTLTGRKTWHGLAPFLGGALGIAISGNSPPDPSGYDFGNKLTVAPEAGVRWYPTRRVSVRTDVRLALWKLNYPASYKVPGPTGCTTNCSRVIQLDQSLTEWTAHPWMTIGLGWTF